MPVIFHTCAAPYLMLQVFLMLVCFVVFSLYLIYMTTFFLFWFPRYQRYKILGCSGIAPVKAEGIENINLTHIVSQHVDYNLKMKEILEEIDLTSTHAHTGVYGGFDAF